MRFEEGRVDVGKRSFHIRSNAFRRFTGHFDTVLQDTDGKRLRRHRTEKQAEVVVARRHAFVDVFDDRFHVDHPTGR